MVDTSVRISDAAYSKLVKARGMLETFHEGRLSLDDAVYISSRFTYEVAKLLMKEMGESVVFATGVDGHTRSGYFLSTEGDWKKYPPEFVGELMELTRLLLREHREDKAEASKDRDKK
jgi:hypothetical protein